MDLRVVLERTVAVDQFPAEGRHSRAHHHGHPWP
jgi:hypothetical protein